MIRLFSSALLFALALVLSGCQPSPHDLAGGQYDLDALIARHETDPDLIHALNDMDKTPLHYAVTYSREEAVAKLIEWGSDIEAKDITGMTPLHLAGTLDRVEEAQLLLDAGANLEAQDNFGDTPLHSAAIFEKLKVMELFLSQGANPNAKNNDGKTPLDLARQQHKDKAVEKLESLTTQ